MKRTSRKQKFLVGLVVVTLLTAAGLEIGARLLDRSRGKPWSSAASRAAIERTARMLTPLAYDSEKALDPNEAYRISRSPILNPDTGWEARLTQTRIAEDATYYRTQAAEKTCDVLVLGGSVAYFFAEQGAPRLAEPLRGTERFRDREVRIHNYALGGFKQPQPAITLATLFAYGHRPDVVIELDGFNEAAIGWRNGRTGSHPSYPSSVHWTSATHGMSTRPEMVDLLFEVRAAQERARAFADAFLRSGVWRSCFLDHAGSILLERRHRAYVAAYDHLTKRVQDSFRDASVSGPAFDTSDEGLADEIVGEWVQGSITMRGLCAARGIPYLHVLQPTLHDRGSKPLTEKEIANSTADPYWIEGVEHVYPRLRAAGDRLAERGIDYVDATRAFTGEIQDLYYDPCHFVEAGNVVLADRIADTLVRACSR
jgi:hypothetical protein